MPLTAGQHQLWKDYLKQKPPQSIRTCAAAHRATGELDCDLLARCVEVIVQRHEALRTRIVTIHGVPHQQIENSGKPLLVTTDLSDLPQAEAERRARDLAQAFVDEHIDLSIGPVFAARLWRLSANEHILILALDHIVSDGFSFGILSRELWTLYDHGARGIAFSLPDVPLQFADYALWQHQTHEDWSRRHEAYWRERLSGAACAHVPPDVEATSGRRPSGARTEFSFGVDLSTELRAAARRERTLLAIMVLTSYAVVLSRWCGLHDFIVIFVSHGRYNKPGLSEMVGFLAHDMYLRVQIDTDATLRGLLKHLQHELSLAYEHLDFDRAAAFAPGCDREPLFNWQSTYGVRAHIDQTFTINNRLRLQPFRLRDVWLAEFLPAFYDTGTDIAVTVYYREDLFFPTTLPGVSADIRLVAEQLARNPKAHIASLPLLSGARGAARVSAQQSSTP